jgi:hypothetical protein
MNAFYEHHKGSIKFGYRCFDRLLLTGLIQPFQQPERVLGFFNAYRGRQRVTRTTLTGIADQFVGWVTNRSEKWGASVVEAPEEERRDDFVRKYLDETESDRVAVILKAREPGRILVAGRREGQPEPAPGIQAALGEPVQFLSERHALGTDVRGHVPVLSFLRTGVPQPALLAGKPDERGEHRFRAVQELLPALFGP